METLEMGKVTVKAKIENIIDVENRELSKIPPEQVRSVEVDGALIGTGASGLMLPKRLIAQLGLRHYRTRTAKGIGGTVPIAMYSAVWLTVQGRECVVDVGEVADDLPVIIGQIPLEAMDWVVDLKGQRLIGNPAHGGEQMIEMY